MALWESAVLSATIARAYGRFEASCMFCFYAWLAGSQLNTAASRRTCRNISIRTTQRSLQHLHSTPVDSVYYVDPTTTVLLVQRQRLDSAANRNRNRLRCFVYLLLGHEAEALAAAELIASLCTDVPIMPAVSRHVTVCE